MHTDGPMEDLNTLLDTWENLALRERKLVIAFMLRLYAGQRKYGPITLDKKDWDYEAMEELLDTCVYMTAKLEGLSSSSEKAIKAMQLAEMMELIEDGDIKASAYRKACEDAGMWSARNTKPIG